MRRILLALAFLGLSAPAFAQSFPWSFSGNIGAATGTALALGGATLGTNTLAVNGTAQYGGQANFGPTAVLTYGSTISWNVATAQVAKVTLTGNATMGAPTNLVDGGTYILRVIQDSTGSRSITWNSVFKWPNGIPPILTPNPNGVDIISFVSDGTNLYGSAQFNFK